MVPEDLAVQFRDRHGKIGKGGVVVVFEGEACGWVDCLRNPEHWRIGAIAVDEDGRKWVASGVQGHEDDSASSWEPYEQVRRRGRPSTGQAKSGAERMAARRERLRQEGRVEITAFVSVEVAQRLDEYLKFKDQTKDETVDRALRAFFRKR